LKAHYTGLALEKPAPAEAAATTPPPAAISAAKKKAEEKKRPQTRFDRTTDRCV